MSISMLKYACILAVTLRGKVNALAYMSTITTASRILCGGSGRTAPETQGCLENLIIAGFAQVAPDFIWLSFFFLDTKEGNVPSKLHACRCFRFRAPNRLPA